MAELSLVDASGVRQTRTGRTRTQPTGAASGQPTVQSRDFARETTVDTSLQINPLGQIAGALSGFFGQQAEAAKKEDLGKRQADYHRNVARITAKINEDPQKAADALRNRDFTMLLGPDIEFDPDRLQDAAQSILGETLAIEAMDTDINPALDEITGLDSPEDTIQSRIKELTEGMHPMAAAAFGNTIRARSVQRVQYMHETRRDLAQQAASGRAVSVYEEALSIGALRPSSTVLKNQTAKLIATLPIKNEAAIAKAQDDLYLATLRQGSLGSPQALKMAKVKLPDGRTIADIHPDAYQQALKDYDTLHNKEGDAARKRDHDAVKDVIGKVRHAGLKVPDGTILQELIRINNTHGPEGMSELWSAYGQITSDRSDVSVVRQYYDARGGAVPGMKNKTRDDIVGAFVYNQGPDITADDFNFGMDVLVATGGTPSINEGNFLNPTAENLDVVVAALDRSPRAVEDMFSDPNVQALVSVVYDMAKSDPENALQLYQDAVSEFRLATQADRGPLRDSYIRLQLKEEPGTFLLSTPEKLTRQRVADLWEELLQDGMTLETSSFFGFGILDTSTQQEFEDLDGVTQNHMINAANRIANLFSATTKQTQDQFKARYKAVLKGRFARQILIDDDGNYIQSFTLSRVNSRTVNANNEIITGATIGEKEARGIQEHMETDPTMAALREQLGTGPIVHDELTGRDSSLSIKMMFQGFPRDFLAFPSQGFAIAGEGPVEGLAKVMTVEQHPGGRLLRFPPEPEDKSKPTIHMISSRVGILWNEQRGGWETRYYPGGAEEDERTKIDAEQAENQRRAGLPTPDRISEQVSREGFAGLGGEKPGGPPPVTALDAMFGQNFDSPNTPGFKPEFEPGSLFDTSFQDAIRADFSALTGPPPPGASRHPDDYGDMSSPEAKSEALRGVMQEDFDAVRSSGVHGMTHLRAKPDRPAQEQVELANMLEISNGNWLDAIDTPANKKFFNRAAQIIELHESRRLMAYDDATGEMIEPGVKVIGTPHVGVGFNLKPGGNNPTTKAGKAANKKARKLVESVGVDYDKLVNGEEMLDMQQVDQILMKALKSRASWLRRTFKGVNMGLHRWMALLSLTYNSSTEACAECPDGFRYTLIGPKITAATRAGLWADAALEIRDNSMAGAADNVSDGLQRRRNDEARMYLGSGALV